MFRFLLGLAIGYLIGSRLNNWLAAEGGDKRASELLDRANAVLAESRRVLDDTRRQATDTIGTGLKEVAARTEGVRGTVEMRATEAAERAGQVRERVTETAGQVRERVTETAGSILRRRDGIADEPPDTQSGAEQS